MTLPNKAGIAAITMTVIANVSYSLCTRTSASRCDSGSPLISLIVTYAIALFVCAALSLLFCTRSEMLTEIRHFNPSSVALGFVIVLLEAGFILAFRSGWNVGYAALFSNAIAALVLIPISILFFHGDFTPKCLAGVAMTLCGLCLIFS